MKETDLYPPIKAFLEGQGYEVKSEIGAVDVMAVRGSEDPVLVELKTAFSLALLQQGVERQKVSDTVYLAVPHQSGAASYKALKNNLNLCRRLGLGLLTVRLDDGFVEAHVDPGPYKPRKSKQRKARLLKEFVQRVGDPNSGGSTRKGLMTAYRQDALKCLSMLDQNGPTKASDVAKFAGVTRARPIMANNHYGWFERVDRGIYSLSPKGIEAKQAYETELKNISGNTQND